MAILHLANVSKIYGSQFAVNDVSFTVSPGVILGLLGPNGAGKTSTIRMITGITLPDRGSIELFNEPQNERHQDQIGYMPEERGLYRKLPIRMQLEYLGALKGLSGQRLKERIDYWIERFEIGSWQKKKTSELSKGMQQKLQFIVTVLHDPDLLVLDEPLSGLDPINAEIINEVIMEMKSSGKTILLSTHRMEQVEQLCDEIVLIDRGRVVLSGALRELKGRSKRRLVDMEFYGNLDKVESEVLSRASILERYPNRLLLELNTGVEPNEVLKRAMETVEIKKWEFIEPPIKELFLEAVANREGMQLKDARIQARQEALV